VAVKHLHRDSLADPVLALVGGGVPPFAEEFPDHVVRSYDQLARLKIPGSFKHVARVRWSALNVGFPRAAHRKVLCPGRGERK